MKLTRFVLAVLLVAMVASATAVLAAPTVASGLDPAATLTGAVRYRNFNSSGGAEIFVGTPGFVSGTATGDTTWGTGRCVRITYDGVGTLTTTVAASTTCSFTTGTTVSKTGLALGTINYMEIRLNKRAAGDSIAFNNVTLGSDVLGSWSLVGQPGGLSVRNVTGMSLGSFTLTGVIALSSTQPGGDSNFIEVLFGTLPPSDNEGPITSNVRVTPLGGAAGDPVILNGSATLAANVDDTTKGGSDIKSAEYDLDDQNSFLPMDAEDGAFDEVSEDVSASITGTEVGQHKVCVRGTDVLDNVGDPSCSFYFVAYKFDGFYSPVDNNVLNVSKAGQAIPAKWRLTDANGAAIDDPSSFVNLLSYPINCSDLSGSIADAVEEYASGSSGLQYNGDGYWQFNWKTPKSYSGSCRAMYVEFKGGQTSPIVNFQFK